MMGGVRLLQTVVLLTDSIVGWVSSTLSTLDWYEEGGGRRGWARAGHQIPFCWVSGVWESGLGWQVHSLPVSSDTNTTLARTQRHLSTDLENTDRRSGWSGPRQRSQMWVMRVRKKTKRHWSRQEEYCCLLTEVRPAVTVLVAMKVSELFRSHAGALSLAVSAGGARGAQGLPLHAEERWSALDYIGLEAWQSKPAWISPNLGWILWKLQINKSASHENILKSTKSSLLLKE